MHANSPTLIFAVLLGIWFGAALFYVVIVGPAAVQAGQSGVGFLQTLARRYGTGPFFAACALLTVFAGVWMYFANETYESTSASNVWATLGVGLAGLALLLGASANRIAERGWVNVVKSMPGPSMADQRSEVASVIARAEWINVTTTIVLGLALLCVVISRAVI
jgi:hypothetical protein